MQEAKMINFMSYISNHNKKNKQGHIVVTSTKIQNQKRSCQIICKDVENLEYSYLDADNINDTTASENRLTPLKHLVQK